MKWYPSGKHGIPLKIESNTTDQHDYLQIISYLLALNTQLTFGNAYSILTVYCLLLCRYGCLIALSPVAINFLSLSNELSKTGFQVDLYVIQHIRTRIRKKEKNDNVLKIPSSFPVMPNFSPT